MLPFFLLLRRLFAVSLTPLLLFLLLLELVRIALRKTHALCVFRVEERLRESRHRKQFEREREREFF